MKLNLYKAKVISISDSQKKGKIQVRVLPEMKDVKEDLLPWIEPFFSVGMTSSFFGKKLPSVDSLVWVIFDDYFIEGFYLGGMFIPGFFNYSTIESGLSAITEISSNSYPNIDFEYHDNGNITFNNIDTGDIGILHKSGSYSIINSDGDIINYSGGVIKLYSKSGSLEIDNTGIIKLNGDTKSFVTHAELQTALDLFLNQLNISLSTTPIIGNGSPQGSWIGFPTSIDISSARTTKVKTGG